MAELNSFSITTINDLLKLPLSIPNYQRPFRWSEKSSLMLLNDILEAVNNNVHEYRIGTVILNEEKNTGYYKIVDGQQRITTLLLILKILNSEYVIPKMLNYNSKSVCGIKRIHAVLLRKLNEIKIKEQGRFNDRLIDYISNQCTVVQVITLSEQMAFQFFDSQNSRGKSLEPHDLLKSYHLREMMDENENEKLSIISKWERESESLSDFFKFYLYPLISWYKSISGIDYSVKKIDSFKGIKRNSTYNFAVYHKASNLYIENYNKDKMYEISSLKSINQFQLTQPIVSGKCFFLWVLHYHKLFWTVYDKIKKEEFPRFSLEFGDCWYVSILLVNVCLFFVDKFNIESLDNHFLKMFYKWCFSLRLIMSRVYIKTLDKYALGRNDKLVNPNLFKLIYESNSPYDLEYLVNLVYVKQESISKEKYLDIWKRIYE